jgi:dihydroflavonol-4-reductase
LAKKRFLVIGGTGFIGSNLVRYLIEKKNEVFVYHRKDSNLRNLHGLLFQSIIGDLTDNETIKNTLSQALDGCCAVFNLAGCTSLLKKHHRLREIIDIEAAKTIAYVTGKFGSRLIHISSSTAIGFPENNEIADENFVFNANNNHYALTKKLGEQAVLEEVKEGLDAVIAIPCSTVGPKAIKAEQLSTFKSIAESKMWIYPPGGLCLTNIDDLVRGLYFCYERGENGKRYILGGHNITYKQYFDEIAHVTKGKAPKIRLPKILMPWLGLGVEVLFSFLKMETKINKNVAMLISKNLFYSSGMAMRELDYNITDWRETIRNTINHLQIN